MVQETATQTEAQPETAAPAQETVEPTASPAEVAAEQVEESAPPSPLDTFKGYLSEGSVDLYEIEELEPVKKHLERRDRQQREEVERTLKAEYDQRTANWESTEAARKIAGLVGSLEQKLDAGDYTGAERIVERLSVFGGDNLKNVIEMARNEGRDAATREELGSLYRELTASLDRRSRDEFQDNLRPGMSWADAIKLRDDLKWKPIAEKHKADLQKAEDTIGSLKAQLRGESGPNLAPSSPGGAGINSLAEAERRYNLPSGHRDKITHDQFKEAAQRFGAKYV